AERQLWRMLLEPRLGGSPDAAAQPGTTRMATGWRQYSWFMSTVALENILQQRPPRWLPAAYHSWDDLLAAALDAAVAGAPRNLRNWSYGDTHTVALAHPVFGSLPLLRRWASTGEWPLSGNGNTVKQVLRTFGPSERATYDLADLDGSYLNIPT